MERRVDVPMDERSAHFVTTERSILEQAVASMPISNRTPAGVASMLRRSRQQFVLGGADYDNFVDCLGTAFKAIEALLRMVAGPGLSRRVTLGPLIERCFIDGLLTDQEHDYLSRFVLLFRNKLAHPPGPLAFTPGMSEVSLSGCHQFVAEFTDRHAELLAQA